MARQANPSFTRNIYRTLLELADVGAPYGHQELVLMRFHPAPENRCSTRAGSARVAASFALVSLLLALPRSEPLRAQGGAAPAAGAPPGARPELELQIGHTGRVLSVVFLPDGKTLASAGGDQIKLWDIPTGALQRTL